MNEFPLDMTSWTIDQVEKWLKINNLAQYSDQFKSLKLDGFCMSLIENANDLSAINFQTVIHKKKILALIKNEKSKLNIESDNCSTKEGEIKFNNKEDSLNSVISPRANSFDSRRFLLKNYSYKIPSAIKKRKIEFKNFSVSSRQIIEIGRAHV